MPATPRTWIFHSTAPGVTTDVTGQTLRHKWADADSQDLSNPLPIPSSGINYGWLKCLKVAWITPPTQSISDLKWYLGSRPEVATPALDPALGWSGITLWAAVTTGYLQPGAGDQSALRVASGVSWANADAYGPSTPLLLCGTANAVVLGATTGVGLTQRFLLLQMAMTADVTPGVKAGREGFWRWKEI